MSQLRSSRLGASEPIHTRGNWFWRGDERFLIKGISYIPRKPGGSSYGTESKVDALVEDRLGDLKRDIEVIRELGLNTIQVSSLNRASSHGEAMKLLSEVGIYVLVTVCEDLDAPEAVRSDSNNPDLQSSDTSRYTTNFLKNALRIVDELADHSNLLGFMVSGDSIRNPGTSGSAEVSRAAIRDIKSFLRIRGRRPPPIGVSVNDVASMRMETLQYFTAGNPGDRADFYAPECWSWAYKSSFRTSGWHNIVRSFNKYPVPMFFAAYGTYVGTPRIWQEVPCLYLPDMTGVFSGGCLYTYLEYGNGYGIVETTEAGIERKPEFRRLKCQFDVVNARRSDELYVDQVKNYEDWDGKYLQVGQNRWQATRDAPILLESLESVVQDLRDEQEWEFVEVESQVDQQP